MIAVDTSSLVAFFEGKNGKDTDLLDSAFAHKQVALPPIVVCEILSDPQLDKTFKKLIEELPLLELRSGYWLRAGELRSKILEKGLKSRVADALIAQVCIDHSTPLITRDKDFRHYQKLGSLLLAD